MFLKFIQTATQSAHDSELNSFKLTSWLKNQLYISQGDLTASLHREW